jgi:probable O-glycosylation ligase (exosortase A-associated)
VRDIVLLVALIAVLPLIWRAPIVGVLAWIWISLMSPQREVYGFLRDFELNLVIAAFTALTWIASKERKLVPINAMTMLMVVFGLWTSVTSYLALDPAFSFDAWQRTLKTLLLGLAIITLVNTKARIQAVIWTFAISLGYYGVKGGGFVLLTGGRNHVYGPDNTMIADNNALALALTALLPLLYYLHGTSKTAVARWGTLATMAFSFLAIFGTYSRGALVALLATGAAFATRSRTGLAVLLAGGTLVMSLPALLPPSWFERMQTIQAYNEDTSFTGRVAAWKTTLNIVQQRPLIGGGFYVTNLDWVAQAYHTPGSLDLGRAAHSIYFEVLGDHGVVGLVLYLALVGAAVFNTFFILSEARGRPDLAWARQLARMLQVSIVAFLVGGAALSMAYYDGFVVIMALTTSLLLVVRQPVGEPAGDLLVPRWRQLATAGAAAVQTFARPFSPALTRAQAPTVTQRS